MYGLVYISIHEYMCLHMVTLYTYTILCPSIALPSTRATRLALFFINKTQNLGIIYEIGITTEKDIQIRQKEKSEKYMELSTELKAIHKLEKIDIKTIVITWDGLTTKTISKNLKELNISRMTQSYIITRILKITNDTISATACDTEDKK